MKVELRKIKEYRKGCDLLQFYVFQENETILSFKQTEDPEIDCSILGIDLLEKAKEKEYFYAFIVGIQDDRELWIFKDHQKILKIDNKVRFNLRGVKIADSN